MSGAGGRTHLYHHQPYLLCFGGGLRASNASSIIVFSSFVGLPTFATSDPVDSCSRSERCGAQERAGIPGTCSPLKRTLARWLPDSVGVNDTSYMPLLTDWTSCGRFRPLADVTLISMLPSPASATFTAHIPRTALAVLALRKCRGGGHFGTKFHTQQKCPLPNG